MEDFFPHHLHPIFGEKNSGSHDFSDFSSLHYRIADPWCAGDIGTDKAKKLNLQAALSSLVLLQNPGILPLKGWGENSGDTLGNMCLYKKRFASCLKVW